MNTNRILVRACLVLILGFASTVWSWGALALQAPNVVIPRQFFGLHIHHMFKGAPERTPWPSIPFGSWRLLAAYVDWPNLEPREGKWDFGLLDDYVQMAKEHHVEILLPLVFSPQWASAHPSEKSGYSPGNAAEPKSMDAWKDYVRTVALRYKGQIHDYEIWNEPNGKQYYSGTIPNMVALARVAYETLKQVDPSIIVSSPPATGFSGVAWLDAYLQAGGGKYADVIGYHFYVNPAPPEEMVPLIEQVEQIMRKNGVANKPLWDTETGWAIQNKQSLVKPASGRGFNSIVFPEGVAAAYMARAYVLSWASGVSRLYWFAWDNGVMGLVDADGKTLKDPAIAYGQLEQWLVGATMTTCEQNSIQTWTCTITRPGGYRGWIMWNPTATRQLIKFPVPAGWHVTQVRDLLGHVSPLRPGAAFEISVMPHLLETATP